MPERSGGQGGGSSGPLVGHDRESVLVVGPGRMLQPHTAVQLLRSNAGNTASPSGAAATWVITSRSGDAHRLGVDIAAAEHADLADPRARRFTARRGQAGLQRRRDHGAGQ